MILCLLHYKLTFAILHIVLWVIKCDKQRQITLFTDKWILVFILYKRIIQTILSSIHGHFLLLDYKYHSRKLNFSQPKTWTTHLICKLIAIPCMWEYYMVGWRQPYLLAEWTFESKTSQQESLIVALSKYAIKFASEKLIKSFNCIFPKFTFVPTR